jgi:hypothetical protein
MSPKPETVTLDLCPPPGFSLRDELARLPGIADKAAVETARSLERAFNQTGKTTTTATTRPWRAGVPRTTDDSALRVLRLASGSTVAYQAILAYPRIPGIGIASFLARNLLEPA